jgi:hypothetical protein
MVLTIHQLGYLRLIDAEQFADFPLFELPGLQNQADGVPKLRAREKLIGIVKPQVGEHVAAADFVFRLLFWVRRASLAEPAKKPAAGKIARPPKGYLRPAASHYRLQEIAIHAGDHL